MFHPQPTPYSSFYPVYLPVGVEDDDGLSDGLGDGVQAPEYSTYPQAPFASLSPDGVPGPPASGSGPAGGSCHDAHGGAAGAPVDVRAAPLPVFPFNSTFPLQQPQLLQQQQHQPGAPNSLFEHLRPPPPPLQHLHHLDYLHLQQNPPPSPAPGADMEPNQGLPEDFAAQEAAARNWEPELEVRFLQSSISSPSHSYGSRASSADPSGSAPGPPARRQDHNHCHHRAVRKGRPHLCRKDNGEHPLACPRPRPPPPGHDTAVLWQR
jgi:hypothetical protein